MPPFKRRKFLQFVGASALATLSLGQSNLQKQGELYAQVPAQRKLRKLALLIGINNYLDNRSFAALQGGLNDVALQRQLLIHRFGFNPKDILTLTDAQATRQGILQAFEEHLIKQAQPGDVVVFHFSGNGSQVADPDSEFPDRLNSTLVPVDSSLQKGGSVRDITGHTLWLLMAALKTENVTVVLDASHSGGVSAKQGSRGEGEQGSNLVKVSEGLNVSGNTLQVSSEEKAYQRQWLTRLGMSPSEFIEQRTTGIAKGVLIASTQRSQLAADTVLDGFYAGTFTYLLTQYLWQQTGNERAESAIANITRSVTRLSPTAQQPEFAVKPNSGNEKRPLYFIERQTPPAEAVITKVEGNQVELWLGGIEPQSLQAFAQSAILTIVDAAGKEQGQVQLISRQGLVGKGKVLEAVSHGVQPGALLQERIRGIPGNLTLRIGLDPSLGNDLAEAKQALQAIKRIEVLPVNQGESDYILGCLTAANQQKLGQSQEAEFPPVGSIGLFLPRGVILPGSFGQSGETITNAVKRLQPKLKSLLATRIVQLALNTNSSRLNVGAWMTPEGKEQEVIAQAFSVRGSSKKPAPTQPRQRNTNLSWQAIPIDALRTSGALPALPIKTRVQLHIANQESRALYCSILVIDHNREISVIFPNQWAAAEDVTRVEAGQTLLIPNPSKDNFVLVTIEPKGIAEALIVASSKPLRKTLLSLRTIASRGGQHGGPIALNAPDDPTDVVASLLDDLDAGNRPKANITISDNQDVHSLDTTQLAVMSVQFEVI